MNDGMRWFNTDDLIIHKHFKRTIPKLDGLENNIVMGKFNFKHSRSMTINQNGTGAPSPGDISPPIWVYIYVTLGDEAKYETNNAFQLDWNISTYYKD